MFLTIITKNLTRNIASKIINTFEKKLKIKKYPKKMCDWKWKNKNSSKFYQKYCINCGCTNHFRIPIILIRILDLYNQKILIRLFSSRITI